MTDDTNTDDRTDPDNHIEVEAEDGDPESMDDHLAELQDMLGQLDPDNVAVIGCVAVTKTDETNAEGDEHHGFNWRVINEGLDGYSETAAVMAAMAEFNGSLEDIRVPTSVDDFSGGPQVAMGAMPMPDGLADLFGGGPE